MDNNEKLFKGRKSTITRPSEIERRSSISKADQQVILLMHGQDDNTNIQNE